MTPSMRLLLQSLTSDPSSTWNDTDWMIISATTTELRRGGWRTPGEMIPALELLDSIWRGWAAMTTANRVLALEALGTLVREMSAASYSFVENLRSGQAGDDVGVITFANEDSQDDDLPY